VEEHISCCRTCWRQAGAINI